MIEEFISGDELRVIVNAIKIKDLDYQKWLEKLATIINKKRVPKNWDDNDLADFKQKIILIANEVKRLEFIYAQTKGTKFIVNFDNDLKDIMQKIKKLTKFQKLMIVSSIKENIA